MPRTIELSDEEVAMLADAAEIFQIEANQLASYSERTFQTQVNRHDELMNPNWVVPHRVAIAITKEMARLRATSEVLKRISSKQTQDDG